MTFFCSSFHRHMRNKRSGGIPLNKDAQVEYGQNANVTICAHLLQKHGPFMQIIAAGLMLERD